MGYRESPPLEALRLQKKNMAACGAGGAARARAPRTRSARGPARQTPRPDRASRRETHGRASRRPASGPLSPSVGRPVPPPIPSIVRPVATPHGQPAAAGVDDVGESPVTSDQSVGARAPPRCAQAGPGRPRRRWSVGGSRGQREAGCGTRRRLGRSAVCTSPHVLGTAWPAPFVCGLTDRRRPSINHNPPTNQHRLHLAPAALAHRMWWRPWDLLHFDRDV